jgi:histidine triad (HIT) family protein
MSWEGNRFPLTSVCHWFLASSGYFLVSNIISHTAGSVASTSTLCFKKNDMSDFYCDQVLSGRIEVLVVYETELVLAFDHTQPYFERHVVIIPKQHIESLSSLEPMSSELASDFMTAIHYVTTMLEKETGGCRVNSNIGNYQTTKHLHWYVHSGTRLRNEDGSKTET